MINHKGKVFEVGGRVRILDRESPYNGEYGTILLVETTMRPPNNPLLRVKVTSGDHIGLETEVPGARVGVLEEDGIPDFPTRRTASSTSHRLLRR